MWTKTPGHGVARIGFEAGALAGLLLACSDGSGSLPDPGPTSGIDPHTMLAMLTSEQATTLCQWTAGRMGGYSRTISCGQNNTLSSQSALGCDSAGTMLYACNTSTVGTVEACVNDVVAQSPCTAYPPPCINLIFDCMPM
jgi:hypothetical protein